MLLQSAFRLLPDAPPAVARQTALAGPGPLSHSATACRSRQKHGRMHAQAEDSGGVGGFFKQLQGGLPIVGLLSRLFSPTGMGLEDLSYPEFSRRIYETSSADFRTAAEEMEKRYGKVSQLRYILLILWMSRLGGGLIPANHIPKAAQRIRVSFDIEIEIERFLQARQSKLEEYGMARPQSKTQEQMAIAMDSLCRLGPGLKDGQAISAEDEPILINIVTGGFADVDGASELASSVASGRQSRARAYV
ncbi:hypothetical protein WJX73_001646 [Symbiochloris irregularis]|uniref:Uncharacterized protein n=1 Tax=Symbiochloris irregularis TaxID=706552 RepID=A0AAW1NJP7_9CHLO